MRRILAPVLVLACLLVHVAPLAWAAEAEGHGAGHDENPVNVDIPVAVATVVVFLLLFLVLTKTAWKPILAGLKAREDGIRQALEGAEKANADAKSLLADHQKKVAAAADEARAIVEEGRKDGEALRSKIHTEAAEDAAKERDRALRDIEIAKDAALKDIYDRVAVIAADVAGRILEQKLDATQHRRLVDEAVSSYERSRKAPGSAGGGRG